ncbi:MAG: HDIG domain-containing protein [Methanobacteriota archaeon]|nr:MAG: HDIG domain-containing protein [Euryarchaeota archaeon]
MLHDIGRSVTHGPEHGYQGGRILRRMGFPENIASIVERHVGGGLDAQELSEMDLPPKDLIPTTLEEKIVCLADKLVDEDGKSSLEKEIQKLRKKGLEKSIQRVKELHRELTEVCGFDPEDIEI